MRILIILGITAGVLGAAELRPPIVDAAKAGNKVSLRTLLQQKADVNATEPDGSSALHWAAHNDDAENADALIRAGAKVNAVTDLGVTPLWLASENGSVAVVRRLLDAGANPSMALLSGESALMIAARGGYAEVAELLLAKGADINAHGTRGQTALMWAVSQKHPNVVKVLLAHKVNLSQKSDVWSEVMAIPPHGYLGYNKAIPHGGETALMFAARVGDLESMKLLVAAGANVNDADAWGVSATVLAAHSDFTDMVLYLLDKGADPSKMDAGFSALQEAILRRNETVVAALLEHGANVNDTVKTWTPTRRSSEDYNFDPGLIGATPLWMAARFSEPNVMRMLLKRGADPMFVHSITYVAEAGFGQVERQEKNSILMAAVGMGRAGNAWEDLPPAKREAATLEAVKILVDLGVDMNTAGLDGKMALDGARQLRFESVTSYLTEKGAKATTPAPTGGRGGRGGRGGQPAAAPAK
ncbi:MAG: ankyrin repeat domain-containing protein [Acidobacteriota bacterium]